MHNNVPKKKRSKIAGEQQLLQDSYIVVLYNNNNKIYSKSIGSYTTKLDHVLEVGIVVKSVDVVCQDFMAVGVLELGK